MTFLTAHLPFPKCQAVDQNQTQSQYQTSLPPPNSHLIITDTLPSPSHFTIFHLISSSIHRKCPIIYVDFKQQGRVNFESVLRKMSVILPPTSSGFNYISPDSLPSSIPSKGPRLFDEDDVPTLKQCFESIKTSLKSGCIIILDGLSELIHIGFPITEIDRFVRSTYTEARKVSGVLVSTLHVSNLGQESSEHDLFEKISRNAHCWWRIDSLSSGRSGDVHGEISSFPLALAGDGWPLITKSQPLQYRLEGSSVKVFPKGTGRGYL